MHNNTRFYTGQTPLSAKLRHKSTQEVVVFELEILVYGCFYNFNVKRKRLQWLAVSLKAPHEQAI